MNFKLFVIGVITATISYGIYEFKKHKELKGKVNGITESSIEFFEKQKEKATDELEKDEIQKFIDELKTQII